MIILGIETSCDDTCIAIYDTKNGLITNKKYTQPIHTIFGGVIPKYSSLYHLNKLIHIIKSVFLKLKLTPNNINAIAYTAGPGLYNSLLIGAYIAYSISYTLNIPIIGVNHLEGHIFSAMINKNKHKFPFISLLISGGHTQLIDVHNIGHYKIIDESLDDSLGETFDKIAKLLDLSYPGGENLSHLAKFGKIKTNLFHNKTVKRNFSFSGIKTYILNYFKQKNKKYQYKANLAKSFEEYILNILSIKCYRALIKYGRSCLIISGGVSANNNLRKNFINKFKKKLNNFTIYFPEKPFCTDNAAMIAYIGAIRLTSGEKLKNNIIIRPNWSLETLKYPLC